MKVRLVSTTSRAFFCPNFPDHGGTNRGRDVSRLGYLPSILESEGIQTLLLNEHLNTCSLADLPIPEFFPALCVINDTDYEKAVHLIGENLNPDPASTNADQVCEGCGEPSPGNFEFCWNCEAPFSANGPASSG